MILNPEFYVITHLSHNYIEIKTWVSNYIQYKNTSVITCMYSYLNLSWPVSVE